MAAYCQKEKYLFTTLKTIVFEERTKCDVLYFQYPVYTTKYYASSIFIHKYKLKSLNQQSQNILDILLVDKLDDKCQ